MEQNDTGAPPVKTVKKAFKILEILHSREGATLAELADEMDIAKSTIHRHLATLESEEYVVKEGWRYDISYRFLALGEYTRTRDEAFQRIRPKIKQLSEKTNESAQFFAADHGKAVYIYRETGDNAVNTPNSRIGERIPLHATAGGKAILACYPEEKIQTIIDNVGLDSLTPNTITDEAGIYEEVDDIRNRGYSLSHEENIDGIHAVGVPIRRRNGGPIGAISVSGPTNRLQGTTFDDELPTILLEVANQLELNIAYP